MKRFLLILMGFIIAGSVGAGYFLHQRDKQIIRSFPPAYSAGEKNINSYLPDEAALILFFKGLGETWDKLNRTNFFSRLSKSKETAFLASLIPPKAEKGFKEKARYFISQEVFLGAFGQDMALAVYPGEGKEKNSFVLASKTGPLFKFEELLFRQYDKFIGGANFSGRPMGKYEAVAIPARYLGKPCYYSLAEGTLFVSDSITMLQQSLAILEGGEVPRAIDSDSYKKSAGKSQATTRFGLFVKDNQFVKLISKSDDTEDGQEPPELLIDSSFSKISFKNGIRMETNFYTNPDKMKETEKGLVNASSGALKSVEYMPSDSMFFLGVRGMEMDNLIGDFAENFLSNKSLIPSLFLLGQKEETSPEKDMTSIIGNEWSFAAVQGKATENHFPDIIAAVKVRNVEKAAEWIGTHVSPDQKRRYKDLDIHQITHNGKTTGQYFFYDNFLFIGTGQAGMDSIIDTIRKEQPSLRQGKIYSASGVSPANHLVFLFDARAVLDFSKTALQSLPLEIASGFSSPQHPLVDALDLLEVVQFAASETSFAPEKINTKTYVALKDLPSADKKPFVLPKKIVQKIEQKPAKPKSEEKSVKPPAAKTVKETAPMEMKAATPPPVIPEPPKSAPPAIAKKTLPVADKKEAAQKPQKKEEPRKTVAAGAKKEPEKEKKEEAAAEPEEEKFVYSSTFNGKLKRDPFASLIALEEAELAQMVKMVDIGNVKRRLSAIQPINYYIYKRVQKEDPALIRKIERLTAYFKNEDKLRNKPDQEVNEKIQEYSLLVGKLNVEYRKKIISPLNFDIDSLALVGIIRGETNNFALVETPDKKGYTIKPGDIIGSAYGKVVSVTKDKVAIEIQNRNYIGKILKMIKKMELKQEEL